MATLLPAINKFRYMKYVHANLLQTSTQEVVVGTLCVEWYEITSKYIAIRHQIVIFQRDFFLFIHIMTNVYI